MDPIASDMLWCRYCDLQSFVGCLVRGILLGVAGLFGR